MFLNLSYKIDYLNTLLTILYILVLLYITFRINKRYIPELHNFILPGLFLVKLGFAGLFVYIYTYYYGDGILIEDAGDYMHDSKILHDVFSQSPRDFFQLFFNLNKNPEFVESYLGETTKWLGGEHLLFNDTRNILRVNTLFHFLSNGTVFIHFIFFSFLSLLGSFELFQWLKKKTTLAPILLIALITLVPTLAFWTSSIIKEPLLLFGLSVFYRGLFDDISLRKKGVRMVIGGLFVLAFKPYVFFCLVIGLVYYLIYLRTKKPWFSLLIFTGLSLVLFFSFSNKITHLVTNKQADFMNVANGGLYISPDDSHLYYIELENMEHFQISEKEDSAFLLSPVDAFYMKANEKYERFPIQLNEVGQAFEVYLILGGANSKLELTYINNNTVQLIKNIPQALFNTFIEPLPKKGGSIMQLVSFFINILFLLALTSLMFYRKTLNKKEIGITLMLSLFILSLSITIGLVSTVSGAIVRYMLPVQLSIICIFALLFSKEKSTREK